jgi:beta-N-acetylhexosaminidase
MHPPIEQQIASMLVLGFHGPDLNTQPTIQRDIAELGIGGVILFDRDMLHQSEVQNIQSPEQVQGLIQSIKTLANRPIWVAVDQEGGQVARLRQQRGFEEFPSARAFGEMREPEDRKAAIQSHAQMLRKLGFNLNLAPCVDVNINPDSPVIGGRDRAFSAHPSIVAERALEFVQIMQEAGINCCAKHFPGHGSATTDSHLGLTDVSHSWNEAELLPYEQLIATGQLRLVMSAHVMLRQMDAEYPASLSHPILNKLLRQQLGFEGLVVTDDLQMGAISEQYGLYEALKRAIDAGSDLLIFGNNLRLPYMDARGLVERILGLIDQGQLDQEAITQSYDRRHQYLQKYAV